MLARRPGVWPVLIAITVCWIGGLTEIQSGGPLTPPGPPAETMKTLDEVEPRIPLNDDTAPGDANYHHIITERGSYYLTGNLDVTKTNGIAIQQEGVTLDLMGYGVLRAVGLGGTAIEVDTASYRCTIRNGIISRGAKGAKFLFGIQCINGSGDPADAGSATDLAVSDCSDHGIDVGHGWRLTRCTAQNNGVGIEADKGSILTDCIAFDSTTGDGIHAGADCVLERCATHNNEGNGIFAANRSVLDGCTARENSGNAGIYTNSQAVLRDCSAGLNEDKGFWTSNAVLAGCTAYDNVGDGIYASGNSTLENCIAFANGGEHSIHGGNGSTLINCTALSNTSWRGIYAGSGSALTNCSVIEHDGLYDGIYAGFGATLTNCAVHLSTCGSAALNADYSSTLTNCAAEHNTSPYGIYAWNGSTLTNCAARENQSAENTSSGIYVPSFCSVINCVAANNKSTHAQPSGDTGAGIRASSGCTIRGCTTSNNTGNGIRVGNDCHVVANTSYTNGSFSNAGSGGDGAGIQATSSDNRIEGNHVSDNDRGIDVDGTDNLVLRNSAASNTANYDLIAGNRVARIVVPSSSAAHSGNGAFAGSLGSTDPHANFSW